MNGVRYDVKLIGGLLTRVELAVLLGVVALTVALLYPLRQRLIAAEQARAAMALPHGPVCTPG